MLGTHNPRKRSLSKGLPSEKKVRRPRRIRDEDDQHLRQKKPDPADQRREKLLPNRQQVPVHLEVLRSLLRKGLGQPHFRVHGPRDSSR